MYRSGYFPGLHKKKLLTISAAEADCGRVKRCAGFTYFSPHRHPTGPVWVDFTEQVSGFVPGGKGYWHSLFKPSSMSHLPKPDQTIAGFYVYEATILPPGNDLKGDITSVGEALTFCNRTRQCDGFQVRSASLERRSVKFSVDLAVCTGDII